MVVGPNPLSAMNTKMLIDRCSRFTLPKMALIIKVLCGFMTYTLYTS